MITNKRFMCMPLYDSVLVYCTFYPIVGVVTQITHQWNCENKRFAILLGFHAIGGQTR